VSPSGRDPHDRTLALIPARISNADPGADADPDPDPDAAVLG
jgi:hypothetical protein